MVLAPERDISRTVGLCLSGATCTLGQYHFGDVSEQLHGAKIQEKTRAKTREKTRAKTIMQTIVCDKTVIRH